MYEVKILEEAERVIKKWKKSNPQLFKKYQKIFHELADHPRTGIGHPEALKGGNDITYSRHITAHDRIIYDIYDETLVVLVIETELLCLQQEMLPLSAEHALEKVSF